MDHHQRSYRHTPEMAAAESVSVNLDTLMRHQDDPRLQSKMTA